MAARLELGSCPLQRTSVVFRQEDADTAVETDPTQRYLRYPVLLGKGACKRVYKAFDQQEGLEVAWNQVELMGNNMDEEQRERLFAEIRVLKQLRHRNIMTFHDWWYDATHQTINFITEYFTSGTLRQYRKKHKHISETALKRWAVQILEGLVYLHAHDPAIVHRDLKCDNILVHGTSGQVKIADLGLASCHRGLSVVGTPEFMAPEIYDEVYDEKVDIYSFGMCLLELATLEYPYSECRSIPAIFRKVSQGIPPQGLGRVPNEELRGFISLCIATDPVKRPSAMQLLKHGFFDSIRGDSPCGSPTHWNLTGTAFSRGPSSSSLTSLAARQHLNLTSPGSNKGGTLGSPTGAPGAARRSMPGYIEAGRTAPPGALSGMQLPQPGFSSGGAKAGSRAGSGGPGGSSTGKPGSAGSDAAAGGGDKEPLAKGRGSTICVAALADLNESEEEEDSDEEVIVPLEDVLQPHPLDSVDDTCDPLCPAAAAAAAATAAAAASHHHMGGVTEALDADFGPTPSLLCRLASLATGNNTPSALSSYSQHLSAAVAARSAMNSKTAAAAAAAGGASTGVAPCWSAAGSATAQSAAAAMRNSGGGAAQMVGAALAAAAAAAAVSSGSGADAAAAAAAAGGGGGNGLPPLPPPAGGGKGSVRVPSAGAGGSASGGSGAGMDPAVCVGPGSSVLVRCVSNRALSSMGAASGQGAAGPAGPGSTAVFASGGADSGALAAPSAAVSVLCLPSGQIVPMSPVLEKLITHRRNTSDHWCSWDAVVLVPSPTPGAAQHMHAAGGQAGPWQHHARSSLGGLPIPAHPGAAAAAAAVAAGEGSRAVPAALSEAEQFAAAAATAAAVTAAAAVTGGVSPRALTRHVSTMSHTNLAAAAEAAAAADCLGAGEAALAAQPPGWSVMPGAGLGRGTASCVDQQQQGWAAAAVAGSAAAVQVTAMQSPAAGMGRIVVRRKFARHLHPALLTIKRSATL